MARHVLDLPDHLAAALVQKAADRGRTVDQEIVAALEQWVTVDPWTAVTAELEAHRAAHPERFDEEIGFIDMDPVAIAIERQKRGLPPRR